MLVHENEFHEIIYNYALYTVRNVYMYMILLRLRNDQNKTSITQKQKETSRPGPHVLRRAPGSTTPPPPPSRRPCMCISVYRKKYCSHVAACILLPISPYMYRYNAHTILFQHALQLPMPSLVSPIVFGSALHERSQYKDLISKEPIARQQWRPGRGGQGGAPTHLPLYDVGRHASGQCIIKR